MAHYAFLDDDNIVFKVITGRDAEDLADGVSSWEDFYGSQEGARCLRTSYNTWGNSHQLGGTPFRANYAGIGYTYDEQLDAFIPPKPFASWVLNEETCLWDPPVPYPISDFVCAWNEEAQAWEPAA